MKLLTFLHQGKKHAGVLTGAGVAPIDEINAKHGGRVPNDLLEIIRAGVNGIETAGIATLPLSEVTPQLPYETPPKIWCIGLNYLSHAEDINAVQPEEPGSFMKPASCMFQPGGDIVLPPKDISDDVDAEGEILFAQRGVKWIEPRMVEHIVAGGAEHHDRDGAQLFRFAHLFNRAGDIVKVYHCGPLDPCLPGESLAHPAVVRRSERGGEGNVLGQRVGEKERRVDDLNRDIFFIHQL